MFVKVRGFHISSLAAARTRMMHCAFLLVFSLCAAVPAAFASEAKVTFKNNTNRDIFLVLCWPKEVSRSELSSESLMWKKGWYKIEPGKPRTIALKDMEHVFNVDLTSVGYYAESKSADGKKLVWRGTADDNTALIGDIHPTKAFETANCSLIDGQEVRFRTIKLKAQGKDSYAATISFSQ